VSATVPWRRWAPLLLLVSVALNLLLIGAFAGRWTMMPPHPPPPGPGMMRHMIDEMGQGMSDADRAVLERVYQAHAGNVQDQWDQHRAAFDAIRHAIAAQPFDRAALEQALDAAGQQDDQQRKALEQMLLEAASQLSPDGRQRMAGWQPGPH
jgi:uncharacterized membrane protein